MTDPYHPRMFNSFQVTRIPGWALLLIAIAAGALGIGVFLLSASILLVVTPFIVVSALILQWRIRRALRRAEREAAETSIEAEYRIIETRKER
jgi:membrane protein implicated in regulation of membrane protease activity